MKTLFGMFYGLLLALSIWCTATTEYRTPCAVALLLTLLTDVVIVSNEFREDARRRKAAQEQITLEFELRMRIAELEHAIAVSRTTTPHAPAATLVH